MYNGRSQKVFTKVGYIIKCKRFVSPIAELCDVCTLIDSQCLLECGDTDPWGVTSTSNLLRRIRDGGGEVGGMATYVLPPTRYTVTTRMILH